MASRADLGAARAGVLLGLAASIVSGALLVAQPLLVGQAIGQLGTRFAAGVGLSGGQWPRLALARAFMRTAVDYAATARALARTTGAVTVLVSHREPQPPVLDSITEHDPQLTTFAISFVLIGMFWVMHHRVFRADTPGSSRRTMINFIWLFTVVLMPVTTALSGASATDRLMLAIYDGNLLLSSCSLLALTRVELTARRTHRLVTPNRTILAAPLAMSILFAVVVGVAMIVPQASYLLLFALVLTGPLRKVLIRLGLRDKADAPASSRV